MTESTNLQLALAVKITIKEVVHVKSFDYLHVRYIAFLSKCTFFNNYMYLL